MSKKIVAIVGLVPILAFAAVFMVPGLQTRVESVPRRVETWWAELQPHDMYVPAPAEVSSGTDTSSALTQAAETVKQPTATASASATAPNPGQSKPQATSVPPSATPRASATTVPAVAVAPAPPEIKLTTFKHEYQGWNNCGPTTLAMLLSHYGYSETQKELAPILKPNSDDKNVSPSELAAYVQAHTNLGVMYRMNGTVDEMKLLIANGFPAIVETWFLPQPNDGMGHYRLLFAYSDTTGKFSALDSYEGPNQPLPYAQFDADWKAFDRVYLVVYRPEQLGLLNAILNGAQDEQTNWTQTAQRAESEVVANANDAFAWHNLGSALYHLGDNSGSVKAFDRARKIGLPWRMLWYQFDMFEAYLKEARYQDVLDLTAANLKQSGDLEESLYYRGRALQATGKNDDAIKAYRDALKFNKFYAAPAKALSDMGATL